LFSSDIKDDEVEYEIGGRCNRLKNMRSMKETSVENNQK
jgi:hypothetical protein